LNYKKSYFYVLIIVAFVFILTIILYLHYLFIDFLSLFENNLPFNLALIILAVVLFLVFFRTILNPIFKSEQVINDKIKYTLHELNIPVSTIKLNIQLLKKSIEDEKSLQRLTRIEQANENLLKLYNNLEYELQKEIDKIEYEEFYLNEAVKLSLEKFEDLKKDTKIDIDIQNIVIYSDYNGFLIILDNLISNALKYNAVENPYIKIEYKDKIFSIFNRGSIIEAKNIMIVFDKYFQEDSKNSGFGLGLAMVKEFCDKNKILINIETLDDGTKINLNFKNILLEK